MWSEVLPRLASAGFHALAPDLAGYGDSEADPPHTWTRHVEAVEHFRTEHGLERVALVVHDWGGLIGLRWACDHPDAVWALSISDTGFWADGKWHGLADAMRTPEQGEQLVDGMTAEGFAAMLGQVSSGITESDAAEYFKAYSSEERRRGQLELYRSGNFEELEAYEGRVAQLGVPALLLWGEDDPFAPVAGAHRFHAELPGSELEIIEGAGHFVVDDAPERYSERLVEFLVKVRDTSG